MTIRLVICDHHPLILRGMSELFRNENDIEILASCTRDEETLEAVRRQRPDVVILDFRMPGKDGLATARELLAEGSCSRIIIYTDEITEDRLVEAFRIGVRGVVFKETDPTLLVLCVRKVHAGEQWIEREKAMQTLEKLLRREAGLLEISSFLTRRERDITKMVAKGLPNRQIAEQLFISEGTVKSHLHNIYDKLKLKSRMALLHYAQQKGLV